MVIVGRLIPLKRVNLAIETIESLVTSGYDVKLMVLGTGELEQSLKKMITQKRLLNNVFLIGHVNNVQDYVGAADLLIHTSNSEASCHSSTLYPLSFNLTPIHSYAIALPFK